MKTKPKFIHKPILIPEYEQDGEITYTLDSNLIFWNGKKQIIVPIIEIEMIDLVKRNDASLLFFSPISFPTITELPTANIKANAAIKLILIPSTSQCLIKINAKTMVRKNEIPAIVGVDIT